MASRAAALARQAEANGVALDTVRLDQHLLIDDDVIGDLVEAAAVAGRSVVEIGSGAGAITERLAEQADRVLAVEVDKRFSVFLDDLTIRRPNVTVSYGDAKDLALDSEILVANPPFTIVETLLRQAAKSAIRSAALVLGEAACQSAIAVPGSAEFGRLSLQFQGYFTVRCVRPVPSSAFYPVTRTSACILVLERAQARQWPLTALADAFWNHGGRRLTDFLWFIGSRRPGPPSESDGRQVAKLARSLPAIRPLLQRRLQELTQAEISWITSELLDLGHQVRAKIAQTGD
jgi:16S rRNA A1518/A1519 N6-dimethyltransferase RsmA/KsgA/DIM1 with predicted DNA glycosylase/AP lyase activity